MKRTRTESDRGSMDRSRYHSPTGSYTDRFQAGAHDDHAHTDPELMNVQDIEPPTAQDGAHTLNRGYSSLPHSLRGTPYNFTVPPPGTRNTIPTATLNTIPNDLLRQDLININQDDPMTQDLPRTFIKPSPHLTRGTWRNDRRDYDTQSDGTNAGDIRLDRNYFNPINPATVRRKPKHHQDTMVTHTHTHHPDTLVTNLADQFNRTLQPDIAERRILEKLDIIVDNQHAQDGRIAKLEHLSTRADRSRSNSRNASRPYPEYRPHIQSTPFTRRQPESEETRQRIVQNQRLFLPREGSFQPVKLALADPISSQVNFLQKENARKQQENEKTDIILDAIRKMAQKLDATTDLSEELRTIIDSQAKEKESIEKEKEMLNKSRRLKSQYEVHLPMPEMGIEENRANSDHLNPKTIKTTIGTFDSSQPHADFNVTWQKILRHGNGRYFTERNYIDILTYVLRGQAESDLFDMINQGSSLKEILKYFAQIYTKRRTIADSMRNAATFTRLPGEPIEACICRAEKAITPLKDLYDPAAWPEIKEKQLIGVLKQVISTKTRDHLNMVELSHNKQGACMDLGVMVNQVDNHEIAYGLVPQQAQPININITSALPINPSYSSDFQPIPINSSKITSNEITLNDEIKQLRILVGELIEQAKTDRSRKRSRDNKDQKSHRDRSKRQRSETPNSPVLKTDRKMAHARRSLSRDRNSQEKMDTQPSTQSSQSSYKTPSSEKKENTPPKTQTSQTSTSKQNIPKSPYAFAPVTKQASVTYPKSQDPPRTWSQDSMNKPIDWSKISPYKQFFTGDPPRMRMRSRSRSNQRSDQRSYNRSQSRSHSRSRSRSYDNRDNKDNMTIKYPHATIKFQKYARCIHSGCNDLHLVSDDHPEGISYPQEQIQSTPVGEDLN